MTRRRSVRTTEEAKDWLARATDNVDPDNPVGATRAVARIARRFRPRADTSWEAFRLAARRTLEPFFERRDLPATKAVAWAVCDPHFGKLVGEESPADANNAGSAERTGSREEASDDGRTVHRELPDPLEDQQEGQETHTTTGGVR